MLVSRCSSVIIFDKEPLVYPVLSSNVESLMKVIIKPPKNKAKARYAFLHVGEPSVGKASILELITNVVAGNDTDHYALDILDHTNEQGSSSNQSQTNSVRRP